MLSLPARVGAAGVSALVARNSARSSWHSDFSASISLRSICISALCCSCVQTRYTKSGVVSQRLVVLSGDTSTVAMQGLLTMSFAAKNRSLALKAPVHRSQALLSPVLALLLDIFLNCQTLESTVKARVLARVYIDT